MPYPSIQPIVASGNYPITNYDGSISSFFVWGTWGGATASLQFSPDEGTTWIEVDPTLTLLAADGGGNFGVACSPLRVVVAGATGTTSLYCRTQPLRS